MNQDLPPYIDGRDVDKALSLWHSGQVVAIPTETVYGLAADACNGEAVAQIYATKARPRFNPLIVHVANIAMAKRYVIWTTEAERLAAEFWPGPLTLVLRRKDNCPLSELVSAGGETVALRMPAHPLTRHLLETFDGGLAAPSANRSGRISPTSAAHVQAEFGATIPLVIDGGICTVGLESTVLDLSTSTPVILRPGGITRAMLSPFLPRLGETVTGGTLKSPGMLESHYAPGIPVRLNVTEVATDEALLAFGRDVPPGSAHMLNLSPDGTLTKAAANLFSYLRLLDDTRYRAIAVMPIPNEGIGEAINDRLRRAAAPR